MIILARYIMPDDYGKLSMYNTIFTVMGFMWAFASTGYSGVVFFRNGEEEYKKVFTSIQLLSLFSFVFFSVIAILFGNAISESLGIPTYIVFFPAIITFIQHFVQMQQNYFRMKEQLQYFGMISCGGAVVDMCAALLLVVTLGYGWLGRVYSSFVGCAIFGSIAILFFLRNHFFVFDFSKERFRTLLLYGIPLIPQASTTWMTQGCDQYIINHYYSTYEVGVFCMALNLMGIIEMIGFSFNNSNSVTIYKILSDRSLPGFQKEKRLAKETRLILYSFIALIILLVAFVCFVLPFLMPAYRDCVPYFLVLSIFGFLRCVYLLYCNYLYYYKETQFLMWSIVLPSVLHLFMSLWLTKYSLYLTAWIFVVSQMLTVLFVYKKAKNLSLTNFQTK